MVNNSMARTRRKTKAQNQQQVIAVLAKLEAGEIIISVYLINPSENGLLIYPGAGLVGLPDDLKLPEFMSRRQIDQACSFVRLPLLDQPKPEAELKQEPTQS
jgi:hypothetical protein